MATILGAIGTLNGSPLATLAARHGRAVARRTGWLVERYGERDDLGPIRLAARLDLGEPVLLSPSGPRRGRTDSAWRVRMNVAVEPDHQGDAGNVGTTMTQSPAPVDLDF